MGLKTQFLGGARCTATLKIYSPRFVNLWLSLRQHWCLLPLAFLKYGSGPWPWYSGTRRWTPWSGLVINMKESPCLCRCHHFYLNQSCTSAQGFGYPLTFFFFQLHARRATAWAQNSESERVPFPDLHLAMMCTQRRTLNNSTVRAPVYSASTRIRHLKALRESPWNIICMSYL